MALIMMIKPVPCQPNQHSTLGTDKTSRERVRKHAPAIQQRHDEGCTGNTEDTPQEQSATGHRVFSNGVTFKQEPAGEKEPARWTEWS